MKISFFIGFWLVLLFSCNSPTKGTMRLKIENIRLEYGKERVQFYKIFDSENKLLTYKEGGTNTTDSVVYKYDENGNLEGYYEYEPNNEGLLIKTYHKQMEVAEDNSYSFIISDTFNLFENVPCKEIDISYKTNLKMDSFVSDSGFVFKYSYPVGEKVFLVLPFSSNNRGEDNSERLDSLVFLIHNKKLLQEEYFFERDKQVKIKYYYDNFRLIRVRTDLFVENKSKEGFDEMYKYKYVK